MELSQDDFRRIAQILADMDVWRNVQGRLQFTEEVFAGSPRRKDILSHLNLDGRPRGTAIQTVRYLADFGQDRPGQETLGLLINTMIEYKGLGDDADYLQSVLTRYSLNAEPITNHTSEGHTMPVDPIILIGFLLEVGRWAKSELSEHWTLQREQQQTDLTDKTDTQATLPAQLADLPPREVERVTKLIERRRDAIHRARNAKLADREEYDAQRLSKAAFEQRESEHNRTIQQMLDEIETDLEDLGFDVERKPA